MIDLNNSGFSHKVSHLSPWLGNFFTLFQLDFLCVIWMALALLLNTIGPCCLFFVWVISFFDLIWAYFIFFTWRIWVDFLLGNTLLVRDFFQRFIRWLFCMWSLLGLLILKCIVTFNSENICRMASNWRCLGLKLVNITRKWRSNRLIRWRRF